MSEIRLGSLFDGIGVFPLAAVRCGIVPAWASEIEKAPISITKRHFPGMAHLGDVTKLNGGDIPPVHIITFGSPCQNLSQIGNRAGLAGEKSSLFFHAIRIIREMREATNGIFPAIAVWENVMGAFFSNDRMDFRAVLSAFTAADISMPASGRWAGAGMVRGHTPDLAWRLMDAQHWASPRLARRQRVFVVADFGGQCSHEILFKPRTVQSISASGGDCWLSAACGDRGSFIEAGRRVPITRPFQCYRIELSSTSQKMAQLNFEPHGNSNRSDEIGILSDSLNTLADNLQHTLAELKKSNSELEAEISKERELEKKQQEFFSAASHELKTPLTILKGHLMGMLNKVKGYENQESYMERSLAVVEKMETLVKELLYVSKTDGKQRTEYKTIDFAELLRVQIADVTDLLSEKEISLSVDIPDKILCDADPAQMERAIQNVLVNAIRYSPNGEAIYISLSNDKNTVSCKVENTGVHIPEEMIPHLFEAFYRADTSRNRNTGGTGLGLYIVRKIMELHHAKYGIQNTSRGVVFWLEMPQERGAINSI